METVCGVCNAVRHKSKPDISFRDLLTSLRKEFRRQEVALKIKSVRTKKLTTDEFYVNAYYDAYDDLNNEIAIEVLIHHNFSKDQQWDYNQVTDFLIQIFDAVVHEFKHRRQSKKRFHQSYWDHVDGNNYYRDYLSDPDEVDAYALSISIELCRSLGKFRALNYLHRLTALSKLKFSEQYASVNLSAYVGQFGDTSSPIIRKLIKKVYIRLQKIDTDVIFS
jgi:hypothetical protein